MEEYKKIWDTFLHNISTKISSVALNSWFKRADLQKISNNVAVISCDDQYVREWLESNYKRLIINGLKEITEKEYIVTFVINNKKKSNKISGPIFSAVRNASEQDQYSKALKSAKLNPKYVFDNFVVGPSNRLAHAAADAITHRLGKVYNPLFIWGGVGLGKTHLMQAIGNRILKEDPDKKAFYCPSETFMMAVVDALKHGKRFEFREKFRRYDILMIDDIQYIHKWKSTQDELFYTFNELYESGKQMVFVSDKPPSDIPNLIERLKSRFEGGLVADIAPPTYEMRIAILEKKAEERGIDFPIQVHEVIAEIVESNIRELEGALNKVYTASLVTGQVPTIREIKSLLFKSSLTPKKEYLRKPDWLIKIAAKEFGVSVSAIKSSTRKANVALARQVIMYILRKDMSYKLKDVAVLLKRKDHTTVLNAIEKVEKLCSKDALFADKIEKIRKKL